MIVSPPSLVRPAGAIKFLEVALRAVKTIIYIDGQNFLYKVSERLIVANLISSKQDIYSIDLKSLFSPLFSHTDLEIRYYGVKKISSGANLNDALREKASYFADNLRRLKNYLKKEGIIYVPKGSLKVRTGEECKNCGYVEHHFQEKGVDVGITIDLVRDAMMGNCNEIAIVSSDTDLVPALQVVRNENVKITYVSFTGQATTSLAKIANRHITLDDGAILEAYIRSLN